MELTRKIENNKLSFFSEKEEIFSIAEDMQGKDILLTLSGNMRSETLYGFQDELEALLSVSTDGIIILDMKNVKLMLKKKKKIIK